MHDNKRRRRRPLATPLLDRMGLQPVHLSDPPWKEIVVWSDACQMHSRLEVDRVRDVQLVLAGGDQALRTLEDPSVSITAIHRELQQFRLRFLAANVETDVISRGVDRARTQAAVDAGSVHGAVRSDLPAQPGCRSPDLGAKYNS